jgi:anti-sigma B factor antagonist
VSIVTPYGEVDVATAPALAEHLDKVIERDRDRVVADLRAVTFIDSTGLGVLIGAQRRCDEAGRDLRVVVSEPKIHKVFEITGLTEHFTMVESLELAMGS